MIENKENDSCRIETSSNQEAEDKIGEKTFDSFIKISSVSPHRSQLSIIHRLPGFIYSQSKTIEQYVLQFLASSHLTVSSARERDELCHRAMRMRTCFEFQG